MDILSIAPFTALRIGARRSRILAKHRLIIKGRECIKGAVDDCYELY